MWYGYSCGNKAIKNDMNPIILHGKKSQKAVHTWTFNLSFLPVSVVYKHPNVPAAYQDNEKYERIEVWLIEWWKEEEKCVRAQVLRSQREKSVHSMGSKRVRKKWACWKKHRMNLSLQYTEEMKQSILCSWAEPVDDDEPLENVPAGHSTAALFIPVPKPDWPQPIILWQHAWTFTAAYCLQIPFDWIYVGKSFAYKTQC